MYEIRLWVTVLFEKIRYLSVNITTSLIITSIHNRSVIFENNFYFRSWHFMRISKSV